MRAAMTRSYCGAFRPNIATAIAMQVSFNARE
jgi:hypothetical protein